MTATTSTTMDMATSMAMINSGATTGMPAITIAAKTDTKTSTGMTGKTTVPSTMMTGAMIMMATGATTITALHLIATVTMITIVTWTHQRSKNTQPKLSASKSPS